MKSVMTALITLKKYMDIIHYYTLKHVQTPYLLCQQSVKIKPLLSKFLSNWISEIISLLFCFSSNFKIKKINVINIEIIFYSKKSM